MTYADQLKHPRWQRKRLEVLNLADFKCESCSDGGTTLHVHHKRYVKGRLAWEYEATELVALCEPCHQLAHEESDQLATVVAVLPAAGACAMPEILSLLVGYVTARLPIGSAAWDSIADLPCADPFAYHHGLAIGRLSDLEGWNIGDVLRLDNVIVDCRTAILPALRSAMNVEPDR